MKAYKAVIFDWDGTLMDSVARIVSSMQAAAVKYGFEQPTEQAVKGIIGLSLEKSVQGLFPDIDAKNARLIINEYKEQYREFNDTPTALFDDAIDLLQKLKQSNKRLAVATGKGRQGLERVWECTQTKHFFHASRCSDEVNSKPDAQMLTTLLAELNINAEDAVMIGDTGFDLAMANNAKVDSIGVTMGVCTAQQLQQYKPKAIVNSLTELSLLLVN